MSVDVVLPCLDEAGALPWILERFPAGFRPIVVDNGSTDQSVDIARTLGATVVHAAQRGFGAACHAGLLATETDVVCFMDADASLDPQQLHRVSDPVLAGDHDLMLGRRRPVTRRAFPFHARWGNAVIAQQLRSRTGVNVRDLGPMRAARRLELLDLHLQDRRSGYPLEMVTRAAQAGLRVGEVDVSYLPRIGRSKVTGTARGTWNAVVDMRGVLARALD